MGSSFQESKRQHRVTVLPLGIEVRSFPKEGSILTGWSGFHGGGADFHGGGADVHDGGADVHDGGAY